MSRRMPDPAPGPSLRASGDRWLFGYADVVTLLFASFAALYASQVGHGQAAESTTAADVELRAPVAAEPALTGALRAAVAGAGALGVDLVARPDRVTISVTEAGSFAPGRADLTPEAERVIGGLADTLRGQPYAIRVEGHTDDRPIRTPLYASNWELSTARATRVVQFLIEACGIAPDRLSAAGYAEHRPRGPNLTAADRARNRRVDIVVRPEPR